MFTIRNGTFEGLKKENGKTYAEKVLITRENQVTLTHFHYQKMEDIINRGGRDLGHSSSGTRHGREARRHGGDGID